MVWIAYDNKEYSSQIKYIFTIFFQFYGNPVKFIDCSALKNLAPSGKELVISYSKLFPECTSPYHIHIYESGLFGEEYLREKSLPFSPLEYYGNLPVIYRGRGAQSDLVVRGRMGEGEGIETDIDFIASSFFMLSRYEELVDKERDEHGRFPTRKSLAYREGFLNIPVVNLYIELLWEWIDSLPIKIERRNPWDSSEFAACLTHDIDSLKKFRRDNSWRKILSVALREHDPFEAWERIQARLGKEPFDTFDYIMRLNREYGFKSSFYFMAEDHYRDSLSYNVASPEVRKLLHRLERESEIGLHGSYESFSDGNFLRAEKARLEKSLGQSVEGIRQHYLRFDIPLTWKLQEEAGFYYDTTMTYPSAPGFRCGICYPFHPYDIRENRVMDIYELPLTVMDGSLLDSGALSELGFQSFSIDEAYLRIKELIDTVHQYQGIFVLLWHNSFLDTNKQPGIRELYHNIISYLSGLNPQTGSALDIVNKWKKVIGKLPEERDKERA